MAILLVMGRIGKYFKILVMQLCSVMSSLIFTFFTEGFSLKASLSGCRCR